MKRLFSLSFMVAVGICMCSCTQGKSGLTIWENYNDEEHQVFTVLVDDYVKAHPGLVINVQRIPFFGTEEKILTAAATRTTPDIARVDLAFVATLASKQALADLDGLGVGEFKEDLVPAALGSNILGGKTWGVPDQTNCLCLFYNKDLFEQAGLDPERPPETWGEFTQDARKLTNPKKEVFGFAMQNSLWWTFPFFNTYGVKFLSDDGKTCLLNSPEGIAAFQFKVDLYQKEKVEAGAWRAGAVDPDMGFQSQKYAMVLNGPWKIKALKEAKINFGVALIPRGPVGTSTTVGGTNMVIFKNSKHQREAFEFLKYLTSAEAQVRWCNALGQIPVNLKAFDGVDTRQHPYLAVFMEQMKSAVARPVVPNYSDLENIINPEMEATLSGQKPVKDALDAAVLRINKEVLGSTQ